MNVTDTSEHTERYPTSPCTDPPPLRKNLLSRRNPNFWTSQSCFFSRQTGFCVRASVNDEPMFTTEPTVLSARILSLGSKMYPSDIQRMLNKDFTRFMQRLSRIRQNRVRERKAVLLAGWQNECESEDNKEYITSIKRSLVYGGKQQANNTIGMTCSSVMWYIPWRISWCICFTSFPDKRIKATGWTMLLSRMKICVDLT